MTTATTTPLTTAVLAERFLRSHNLNELQPVWLRIVQSPRTSRIKPPRTREGILLSILDEEINYPDRFRNLIVDEAGRCAERAGAVWWKLGCLSGFHIFDAEWKVDDSCACRFSGMTDDPRKTARVRHALAVLADAQKNGLRKGDIVRLTERHRQPTLPGCEAWLQIYTAQVTHADPEEWLREERPCFSFSALGPQVVQKEGSPYLCYFETGQYHSGRARMPAGKPYGLQDVALCGRYKAPPLTIVTPDMPGFKVG